MSKVRKRQSKTVTIAYASIACVVLLVVAAIALVVVPPSPPSVSEFAPQAVEQIEDSPKQQSSQFGTGAGGACPTGQLCEGSDKALISPPKKITEKARVRRCVGDPPRQIEDPQSPPCVNYFDETNGGSTYRGVSRDEIRVVVPCGSVGNCDVYRRTFELVTEFFNRRFEFYSRKIRILMVSQPPSDERSVATRADEELQAFASLALSAGLNGNYAYSEELARRKVLSIGAGVGMRTSGEYAQQAPYIWNYSPPLDVLQRNDSEFACKSLMGRPANYAGPAYVNTTRSFAVLLEKTSGVGPSARPLVDGLTGCGVKPWLRELPPPGNSAGFSTLALDMQGSGITTVLCVCRFNSILTLMNAASNANYYPEWMLLGITGEEIEFNWSFNAPLNQRVHMFGLTSRNKFLPESDEPWYWAYNEARPQDEAGSGPPPPGYGGTCACPAAYATERNFYQQMLLLSSGIQMAGANLTPSSFASGLAKTQFPNPNSGGVPYWQAHVGFLHGDQTMLDDYALWWWNESAQNKRNLSEQGGFCYVERGARWNRGTWPASGHSFFDVTQACD